MQQKPANLILLCNTGVYICLRNIVDNSGSFAKVSIPVKIYNSLAKHNHIIATIPRWL